ncbi:sugar porter family MFS transporter [Bowmanella sp. JS7-9]|uniref:Sugar porter family MFS transporter n=1 Tax=Pseudobowmanella zhangzhouensis TaxID=1537679 RepID=A0ABW1XMA0_9ALTE|nr:sugar porter family MFS transporter [Bowmanella sp. JS7-9]TBX22031.1 major facilitator transporter [Bowmanella sp. JS7-9]
MALDTSQHNHGFIFFIAVVATIGGFLFGFDSGVINGTVDGLKMAFNAEDIATGFNVASMLLGCAVGAFFAGWLADRYGRRNMLRIAALLFIISAWGSGMAGSSLEFIIYRVLGGLAVGAASVMSPAYISEVAPAHYRGRLSSVQQIAIIAGLFIAFVSNYLLAQYAGKSTDVLWMGYEAWRWMFWMELFPAVVFLLALLFIPESPRYLVAKGEQAQADTVLGRLYGTVNAAPKRAEIEQSLNQEHAPRLADLMDAGSGKLRKIVWVGVGLATFQQLVGINVVFYYGAVLWQAAGFAESQALLINIISGGVSIAACLITIAVIDKIGRKPLLLLGSIGMAVSLAVMVWCFSNAQVTSNGLQLGAMGTLTLIAANVYVFFFNMSWGPVMWVMLGEMFPNQIRGSGLAISGLFQWGSNFAIAMTFPIMLTGIGLAGAYGFYALCALVSVWFVVRMVHETKGKELEQMQG